MSDARDVRSWWSANPMSYAATHGGTQFTSGEAFQLGTRAFFERLDQEFYSWNRPLHDKRPFDRLFPFGEYRADSRVLEVGCGLGTMAQAWARNGAHVTAVDLNPTSIAQTRARFSLFGLWGEIGEADARQLPFPAESFDYAYSWGVLHHSPDIARSIAEMMRVLKPGGGFGVMVYNRRSFLHWYMTGYLEGFLHLESQFLGSRELTSRYGDGHREEGNPYTWPMTGSEMTNLLGPFCSDVAVRTLGTDLDHVLQFMLPGLGMLLPAWLKKPWARRFGWSLWVHGHKDA
jgi:SAM-dependent methyltransferase